MTKQQRYERAVERNLLFAMKHPKYKGLSVREAKIKIGIRKDDEVFDEEVERIVGG